MRIHEWGVHTHAVQYKSERECVCTHVQANTHHSLFYAGFLNQRFLTPLPPLHVDFLVERDNDYCVCETPCNMTRYGKEMSFVKIPSKASAKYLAKKYNKTEQYIA